MNRIFHSLSPRVFLRPRKKLSAFDAVYQTANYATDITKISLSETIHSAVNLNSSSAGKEDASVKITTLKNGLRVASQNKFGMHCTLGVMISAGPRYEINSVNGVSHFIEKLGFHSSNAFKDRDEVQAKVENCSAIFDCQISRDFVVYAISGINQHLDTLTHVLSETVLHPKITDEEVDMAARAIGFELNTMEMAPPVDPILTELLHSAAYQGGNTFGLPRYCPRDSIDRIKRKNITEFMASLYKPERVVLVGVGVDHEKFVNCVEQYFIPWETSYGKDSPEAILMKPDDSTPIYLGGELSVNRNLSQYHAPMPEFAHCVIGLEGCGSRDAQFVPSCLLNSLLGGGGSFSAGGPGKGMYTRLYVNILNQHHWVNSAQAASHSYADAGLFAISGSCEPENLDSLVRVIVNELRHTVDSPISAVELLRAKNQLQSMLFMNLEMRPVAFEDIARQVLATGEWKDPEYWVEKINSVTADDLHELLHRMLISPPTIVGYGRMDKWAGVQEIVRELSASTRTSKSFSERFPKIFKQFI